MILRVNCKLLAILVLASAAIAQDEPRECTAVDFENYLGEIPTKRYESWKVPYGDTSIQCTVLVKQNFRGEVMDVGIAKRTDDAQIHKSVINAAYEASPMPRPAVRSCFQRDINIKIEAGSQQFDQDHRPLSTPAGGRQASIEVSEIIRSHKKAAVAVSDHAHKHRYGEQCIRS